MKKRIVLVGLALAGFIGLAVAKDLFRGELLTLDKVKQTYGTGEFDAKKFREGSPDARAKMAYSIISKKTFIGQPATEVTKALGPHDGYYFSDSYPAYAIDENWKLNKDTWQIVFFLDKKDRISKVAVHKNCCDK